VKLLGVVLVSAAACNQAFELEPTISVDPVADVDKDGIPDTSDNCPTLANDQKNRDGDPFGDACDHCPDVNTQTTHDEDGDLVGDECDVCPGFEDLGADDDNDGVGDNCDPNPSNTTMPNRRVAFEPFVAMPVGWQASATAWIVGDDSIAPVTDLAASEPGLTTSLMTGAGRWASAAKFYARTRWQPPDRFGLIATGPTQTISCTITCTTANAPCTGIQRVTGGTMLAYDILPRPEMLVAIYVQNAGSAACVFEGSNLSSPQFSAAVTSGLTISLVASPRIRATYFEHGE
jgi:hypothetical protein